jgi:acyl-CoA reductase-like NAD-dependent aldehyde dehydrogenase
VDRRRVGRRRGAGDVRGDQAGRPGDLDPERGGGDRTRERSPYGLLSAIFTRDLRRALRFAKAVRTGWVNVNEGTNYWEPHLPFGGRAGSQSGVGRVGGRFSMDRLTELKTIVIDLS